MMLNQAIATGGGGVFRFHRWRLGRRAPFRRSGSYRTAAVINRDCRGSPDKFGAEHQDGDGL